METNTKSPETGTLLLLPHVSLPTAIAKVASIWSPLVHITSTKARGELFPSMWSHEIPSRLMSPALVRERTRGSGHKILTLVISIRSLNKVMIVTSNFGVRPALGGVLISKFSWEGFCPSGVKLAQQLNKKQG